jgi:hypothetical protein
MITVATRAKNVSRYRITSITYSERLLSASIQLIVSLAVSIETSIPHAAGSSQIYASSTDAPKNAA